jgi:hypothetical protein
MVPACVASLKIKTIGAVELTTADPPAAADQLPKDETGKCGADANLFSQSLAPSLCNAAAATRPAEHGGERVARRTPLLRKPSVRGSYNLSIGWRLRIPLIARRSENMILPISFKSLFRLLFHSGVLVYVALEHRSSTPLSLPYSRQPRSKGRGKSLHCVLRNSSLF